MSEQLNQLNVDQLDSSRIVAHALIDSRDTVELIFMFKDDPLLDEARSAAKDRIQAKGAIGDISILFNVQGQQAFLNTTDLSIGDIKRQLDNRFLDQYNIDSSLVDLNFDSRLNTPDSDM